MRNCNGCTLCCFFPDIPDYESPCNEYCKNCKPNIGCSIYKDRKELCRGFECLWKLEESLPESLRPNECGVMVEVLPNQLFIAYVDPEKPEAWKDQNVQKLFHASTMAGHPVVVYRKGRNPKYFLPEGTTIQEVINKIYGSTRL